MANPSGFYELQITAVGSEIRNQSGRSLAAGATKRWINRPGDANRNSVFDTQDLIAVFARGEYDDRRFGNSTWSGGDWNADGDFNSSDLIAAFQSGGFEIGPIPPRGDFDGNDIVNAADIDALFIQLRLPNPSSDFDLTGDGRVNELDRDELIKNIFRTTFGDANLDRVFNSTDFVAVFQFGEYEDTLDGNSTWSEGDWNGDGDFTTSDLVLAFQSGGYVPAAVFDDAFFESLQPKRRKTLADSVDEIFAMALEDDEVGVFVP